MQINFTQPVLSIETKNSDFGGKFSSTVQKFQKGQKIKNLTFLRAITFCVVKLGRIH